jgi:hypothetical protein
MLVRCRASAGSRLDGLVRCKQRRRDQKHAIRVPDSTGNDVERESRSLLFEERIATSGSFAVS